MSNYEKVFNEEENYIVFDNDKECIIVDLETSLITKMNKRKSLLEDIYEPISINEFKMIYEVVKDVKC